MLTFQARLKKNLVSGIRLNRCKGNRLLVIGYKCRKQQRAFEKFLQLWNYLLKTFVYLIMISIILFWAGEKPNQSKIFKNDLSKLLKLSCGNLTLNGYIWLLLRYVLNLLVEVVQGRLRLESLMECANPKSLEMC